MTTITREILINAPRQQVWDVIADFGNVYKTNPGITSSVYTSTRTSGIGTTRSCDMAMMKAKVFERITVWDEGERLVIDVYDWRNLPGIESMGAEFNLSDANSVGVGNGERSRQQTRLRGTINYAMKWGAVGRFLDATAMNKQNVKGWELFLAGIKRHVETGETIDKSTRLSTDLVAAV